ncbi:MAG: hypothetical protein H7333_03025 [Bdellovibrionales bacterium]|nr:hypothetical protein [Oligoflexia bacterium]
MKNYLALVLALAVVSSPAFASRARLESLGEGKNGSYYIDDSRNMFLNPAQIVHYKKKLFLELGPDTVGAPDVAVSANRGQGGFTNTFGDFTYGVYMNQTSQATLGIVQIGTAALGGAGTFLAPDSTLEFTLAGEAGLNWGISLFYAGNEDKVALLNRTASQVGARIGVEAANFQAFSTVGIVSKSTIDGAAELKGNVGIDAGATYKMSDAIVFAKFTATGADVNPTGGTTTEIRNTQYGLGLGWKHEMTKMTNLYARLEADYQKLARGTTDNRTWNIPVSVGAEAQALSWLAIRGSIQQSLLGQTWSLNNRSSLAGTTTVAAGLGLTFGDVQIDGLVATNGANNPTNNITGFGTAPVSNTGFGFGDNMLTRLAMTYNF